MRILGIDPGYGIIGFGLVDANRNHFQLLRCGAITTPAGMDFSARLEIIYEDMKQLLEVAHFLLQCMKVRRESEVAQPCLTLSDPMDCSLPGSSVCGIFQARVLEWGAIAFVFSCVLFWFIP